MRCIGLAIALACVGTGCSSDRGSSGLFKPYRYSIPQGNYINAQMVDSVRVGMSREMVRNTLGSPLIVDPFHPERWDYVFRFKHANGESLLRRTFITFENDRVSQIEKLDPLPDRDDRNDPALPGFEQSLRQRAKNLSAPDSPGPSPGSASPAAANPL